MQIGNYRFDGQLAIELLEKAGFAVAILVVTWLLASAAKWTFAKLVDKVSFLQRGTGNGETLGASLGKIVGLLIWLLGLLGVLQVLGLSGVSGPINALLNEVMGFIPNMVGAGLLLFIGLMIAQIVRDLVMTSLQTVDLDKWANKGGVDEVTGNSAISKLLGTIAYALIAIPVVIGALGVLNIASISDPATQMLNVIMYAIPNIIAAGLLLGIGYLISRFVVGILVELLSGLGIDRPISALGLLPDGASASAILARIAQIAIILFFAIAATRMLGFPELTLILDQILELGGRVLFGAVVIGAGFLIANLLGKVVGGADSGALAGSIVRYSAMLLFTFMGLQFMEIGQEIVQTAFSAVVIAGAVAAALAFGLGGRDWAAKKLEQIDDQTKK